jgi:hypothetical protein
LKREREREREREKGEIKCSGLQHCDARNKRAISMMGQNMKERDKRNGNASVYSSTHVFLTATRTPMLVHHGAMSLSPQSGGYSHMVIITNKTAVKNSVLVHAHVAWKKEKELLKRNDSDRKVPLHSRSK